MEPVKIHIPQELFEPAETQTFSGQAQLGQLEVGAQIYECTGPCAWEVEITNTGRAFLVRGKSHVTAKVACARCLEDTSVELAGDIEGYFVMDAPEQDEDLEGDEFEALPADHAIDLAPLITAGLLLEAPFQPLCREDCAGLCPQCGANLNDGPCGCEPEEGIAPKNPFAVLKGMDLS